MVTLGERIRQLRHQHGLTLKELGRLTYSNPSSIGTFELETREPRLVNLRFIAAAFGMSVVELLEGVKGYDCCNQDSIRHDVIKKGEHDE